MNLQSFHCGDESCPMCGPLPAPFQRPAEPPMFAQCVIGYRSWELRGGQLWPVAVNEEPWRTGVNHASCRALQVTNGFLMRPEPRHAAPGGDCTCGLYALHEPLLLLGYITGAIAAWGNLEVHHDGFRAEHAQIVALAEPRESCLISRDAAADVARQYGVPLVPFDQLQAEALKHGDSLPASMRPPKPLLPSALAPIIFGPPMVGFIGPTPGERNRKLRRIGRVEITWNALAAAVNLGLYAMEHRWWSLLVGVACTILLADAVRRYRRLP